MLPLFCRSVTKELWGTGADTSSDTQPPTTRLVQTCSSQSPASSTAHASFTSTESQVGWSVQQFGRRLQSKGQMNYRRVVCCRLEYMPAKRECHLWSGFTLPSPWLYPQRWKDCRGAEVRAGNVCPGRSYLQCFIWMFWLNTIVSTGVYILKAQLPYLCIKDPTPIFYCLDLDNMKINVSIDLIQQQQLNHFSVAASKLHFIFDIFSILVAHSVQL